jgi:glycosyltransferase involved in cell wall biosynthesis
MTALQLVRPGEWAHESVFALLQRRDYEGALAIARGLPPTHPERWALERVALARARRFAEAAIAGRHHLAGGLATTEDLYRQAQILLKCGAAEEAFAVAAMALDQAPEDWRFLVPVIEAVLTLPELEPRLQALAAPIIAHHPRRPPPPMVLDGGVYSPNRLPHTAALGGEHPIARALIESLAPLPIHRPESYGTGLVAAALAALPRARQAVEALLAAGLDIDRATAATYAAARFPSLLADDGGCDIEMLWHLPNSLGERPYFFHFDFMPMLFLPFAAAEHMDFPEQDPGIYRILKQQMESPECLGIITHAEDAARQFADIFESPAIARKCTLINLPSDIGESLSSSGRPLQARGRQETVTLFFAASAAFSPDGFFGRGGVDVLNAFAELSEEFGNLRLILRGQLPKVLSARLTRLVQEHPGIRWIPDRLSQDEHEDLLRESDIFVMPSIGIYRNGLIQALRFGLVPVVADCFYAENFIEPERTGLIARGRSHITAALPGRFRSDWRAIFGAVDQPSDPIFFQDFKTAIRRLASDRELLHRISAHNLAVPTRHNMQQVDIDRFREVIQDGIGRARRMKR